MRELHPNLRRALKIIPDHESMNRVELRHPDKSYAMKYQLMQADTLVRLAKAGSADELNRMAEAGILKHLISEHNRRLQNSHTTPPIPAL